MVTFFSKNGTVIVTATSKADDSLGGTIELKVAIKQDVADVETIVEDGTVPESGDTGTINGDITWKVHGPTGQVREINTMVEQKLKAEIMRMLWEVILNIHSMEQA